MKSEDIQNEIERTRGEMASTIEEIERKLSPRQLMDQAVDTMREFASDSSRVGHAVRENPIPLTLIGLGLGWLAYTSMRHRGGEEMMDIEPVATGESVATSWVAPGVEDYTASTPLGSAGMMGGDGQRQRIKAKASEMAGQARERMSEMRERVSEATDQTRQRVSQWGQQARSQASQAADRTWETYQDHPFILGAVAAAAGAVIGAMLPRTRQEREVLGTAAESVMRTARETGGELMDKASRVANRAVQAAKREGAEAVRSVKESAKDEAARQGLASEGVATTPPSTLTH